MQRAAIRDDVSIEHIQAIMAAQTDRQTRLAAADDVVSNEGNLHQLTEQIEKIHQSYLKISEISG
jgi:dephospho-CoA kinase